MKKNVTRLVCLLLAAVLALGLAACSKEPSDPNHIVIGDYVVQYKSACIRKDTNEKDAIVLTMDFTNNGKKDADYLWNIYNKAMQDGFELESAIVYVSEDSYETVMDSQFTEIAPGKTIEVCAAYTLRDAKTPVEVTFTDLLDKYKKKITIDPTTLAREEAKAEPAGVPAGETGTDVPAAAPTAEPTAAPIAAPTGDALLDWWNGDWYGWWKVASGDGDYEQWQGKWWDCCANISIGADYTGSVIVWDEDLPKDNALCEATVTLSAAGTGEHGAIMSESGYFLDGTLAHADWIVDPGLMNYDDFFCIDGWYEDGDGSFKYEIYLRPWGTLWDDVAADYPTELPGYYESWYLPLVEAGKPMPDTLDGAASDVE